MVGRRRRFPRRERPLDVGPWLGRVTLAALIMVAAAGAIAAFVVGLSLPKTSGTLRIDGVSAPIEIVRDRHGVPHIFAAAERDAWFALGYVHAQDRQFQMEMMRRTARGRLSEVLGGATLDSDRFFRTLGLVQQAEATLAELPPDARARLDAYAAGVNALIAPQPWPPPELVVRGAALERWTTVDSLLWGRLMALQLGGNWRDELTRARLLPNLPPGYAAELWPDRPADAATTLASLAPLYRALDLDRLAAHLPWLGPSQASNEWVVSGDRTAAGKPLLVNDPHLTLAAPGTWYLVRIVTPELTLTGASAPGVPAIVLGHNGHIAWGFTTTNGDQADLFIERIDPEDRTRYLTPDGPQPFATRAETIAVRGEPDVAITVRTTRHGPVISDAAPALTRSTAEGHAVALSTPAFYQTDRTALALFNLNKARSWDAFRAALADWHAPMQNIVYADITGDIGLLAPALLPRRGTGDGWLPQPGWTGEADWNGFASAGDLTALHNPSTGRIVNANNRLVPEDFPLFITREWDAPYRAERIHELLDAMPSPDVSTMEALLSDPVSRFARAAIARLDGVARRDEPSAQALDRLRRWEGAMRRDRAEPLIFNAWMRELYRALLGATGERDLLEGLRERPEMLLAALEGRSAFCKDTPDGCDAAVADALARAVQTLTTRFGPDMETWRWGRMHYAPFRHPLFARVPLLRDLVGFRVATDGDYYTVNRGASRLGDGREPFAHVHGAGYRAIYDLADLSRSRFIVTPGQSGHPLSRHWGDLVGDWADGRHITLTGGRNALRAAGGSRLVLAPR
jgi:penicillin amidase